MEVREFLKPKDHDKLTETFGLSVDSRFKEIELKAKACNFKLQDWVRSRIYPELDEVEALLTAELQKGA